MPDPITQIASEKPHSQITFRFTYYCPLGDYFKSFRTFFLLALQKKLWVDFGSGSLPIV